MLVNAMRIFVMWPNMIWIENVNYFFTMFVLNSLLVTISNYHMHKKMMNAIYAGHDSLRFAILFVVRIFLLFCIVMWGMYPIFGLRCSPDIYPDQLATLMYMEFFNACMDLYLTFKIPKQI